MFVVVLCFQEQRASTVENVERKMARTADELAEESSESEGEGQGEESSDEEEGVPYNPKNLPLGWDGKPIPYWLYKLHGLNVSYSCEICGNAVYRGPKAFQRHFSVSPRCPVGRTACAPAIIVL